MIRIHEVVKFQIMYRIFLLVVIVGSLFVSCDKSEPLAGYGSLELVFKARYGTQPLVYATEYNYFDIGTILFSKTDFFYSNLKLLNSKDSILVTDVNYVSLMEHHTSIALAEEGLKIRYDSIPTGDFTALDFNIGLTPEQNKTKPSNYVSTHPLGEGTRYWAGWISYIFSKTEGVFKNGTDNPFTYHSGFDNAMIPLHFAKTIKIENGKKTSIQVLIDYKNMFNEGSVPMDIPSNPQIHNTSLLMLSFVKRFNTSVTIQ